MLADDQTLTKASSSTASNLVEFTGTTDRSVSNTCTALSIQKTQELASASLLWRSVLSQALKDLYGTNPKDRMEVLKWLKTTDFDAVCDFACVEVASMREQFVNIAGMPWQLARKYGKNLSDLIMYGVHGD